MVDSLGDEADAALNGSCATVDGTCTLRAAIEETNNTVAVVDVISFAVTGSIRIATPLPALAPDLEIVGPGPDNLTVDATNLAAPTFQMGGAVGSRLAVSGLRLVGSLEDAIVTLGTFIDQDLVVSDCSFESNRAGIRFQSAEGDLRIESSSFVQNGVGGGVGSGAVLVLGLQATAAIEGSFFGSNRATGSGGALLLSAPGSSVIVRNSTFSANTSQLSGGAVFIGAGSAFLSNVTAVFNEADADGDGDGDGGGIANGSAGTGSVRISNSLVARNASGGQAPDCAGELILEATNLVQDLTGCDLVGSNPVLSGVDPGIVAVALSVDGSTRLHPLVPGSPAADAGDNDGCESEDQRGLGRPQDGNADGDPVCDLGAFEATGVVTVEVPTLGAGAAATLAASPHGGWLPGAPPPYVGGGLAGRRAALLTKVSSAPGRQPAAFDA